MSTILIVAASLAFGGALGFFLPRLFPKYPKGTRLRFNIYADRQIRCEYLRRSGVNFHHVRVLPGDAYWPAGKVLVAKAWQLRVTP